MINCKFAQFYSRKCRRKNLSYAITESFNTMILTNKAAIIMRIASETSRNYDEHLRWKIENIYTNLFANKV